MSTTVPHGEYAKRIDLAKAALVQANADALIVDHSELLAWLTGYTVSETMYRAFVLPRTGEPWFVLRKLDAVPCERQSWVQDRVEFKDDDSPWQVVADSLRQRGLGSCRLAADFHSYGFTVNTWQTLQRLSPEVKWVDMSGVSDRLRCVKSEHELACIRVAATVADDTIENIANEVQAGWSVREVAALAAKAFLLGGADSGETGPIVRGAGEMGFLHSHRHDEVLQKGDILHVELTPKFQNYSARLMRPFVVGAPGVALESAMEETIALQDRQIREMRPGMCAADVDSILREGLLSAGLRNEYDNVTGYSLGLYGRTPRTSDFSFCFTPKAVWLLEENMVFHMYVSAQGFAFSETVVVTPAGGQRLTSTPRRFFQIGVST